MARIIAVTACPSGVAHTYMAAEALESDLDGEAGPQLPLTIDTIPGAIAVYC